MVTIAIKMIQVSGLSLAEDNSQFEMRKRNVQTNLLLFYYNVCNDFGINSVQFYKYKYL